MVRPARGRCPGDSAERAMLAPPTPTRRGCLEGCDSPRWWATSRRDRRRTGSGRCLPERRVGLAGAAVAGRAGRGHPPPRRNRRPRARLDHPTRLTPGRRFRRSSTLAWSQLSAVATGEAAAGHRCSPSQRARTTPRRAGEWGVEPARRGGGARRRVPRPPDAAVAGTTRSRWPPERRARCRCLRTPDRRDPGDASKSRRYGDPVEAGGSEQRLHRVRTGRDRARPPACLPARAHRAPGDDRSQRAQTVAARRKSPAARSAGRRCSGADRRGRRTRVADDGVENGSAGTAAYSRSAGTRRWRGPSRARALGQQRERRARRRSRAPAPADARARLPAPPPPNRCRDQHHTEVGRSRARASSTQRLVSGRGISTPPASPRAAAQNSRTRVR